MPAAPPFPIRRVRPASREKEEYAVKNELIHTNHHPDYPTQIAQLLESRLTPGRMRQELLNYHENDMAAALESLDGRQQDRLCSLLQNDELADLLPYAEDPAPWLDRLPLLRRVQVLSHADAADAADYLQLLPRSQRDSLLELLSPEARQAIALLVSFDEDSIGRYMTTNYISIPASADVRTAMKTLVSQAADNDNIATLYVVDQAGRLAGAIDLKDLIIAREGTPLDDITASSYPYVYADEDVDQCLDRLSDYSEDSIPVLDESHRLQGVLTAQDLADLLEEKRGDDYARLGGLSAGEDLDEPLRRSITKRLPWLIILLGLGMVVSAVVGLFETVVAQLTLIVSFQSLVLDMAGNVGTQSLAVTIRVLTDSRVDAHRRRALIWKEARVGLVNGLLLGSLSFLLIGGYLMLLKGQPPVVAFSVSFCTGAALLLAMFLSSAAGTVVPLLFQKLHVDPAVASGPLITTLNDLAAVVTYYGLAWLFLLKLGL